MTQLQAAAGCGSHGFSSPRRPPHLSLVRKNRGNDISAACGHWQKWVIAANEPMGASNDCNAPICVIRVIRGYDPSLSLQNVSLATEHGIRDALVDTTAMCRGKGNDLNA